MHGKHLQSLTVAELRTLAHKRGLRPSGTKNKSLLDWLYGSETKLRRAVVGTKIRWLTGP